MFSLSEAEKKAKAAQKKSAKKLEAMAHPMAKSSQAKSKAPPLPGGKAPKGIAKGKGYTFTMGKLSLLAISLSMMLLGAFTFFSGFLVGAWYYGNNPPPAVNYPLSQSGPGGMGAQAVAAYSSRLGGGAGVSSDLAAEAQKIGLGSMAGGAAGYQVQSAIDSASIPGVPSFLQPFVEQVKYALGGQAGSAASKVVQGGVHKSVSEAAKAGAVAPKKPASPHAGGTEKEGASSSSKDQSTATAGHSSASQHDQSSSAQVSASSKSAKGDFTVQLGAYVAKENAEHMTNSLKLKNFDAYIQDGKESSGQPIYYVRVGHYDTYDIAHTVALNFVDNSIPGATIVKVSNDKK